MPPLEPNKAHTHERMNSIRENQTSVTMIKESKSNDVSVTSMDIIESTNNKTPTETTTMSLSSSSPPSSNGRRRSIENRGMPRTRLRRRIRSRSAPAGFNRKNQHRRLVEQHFKIDKENLALLPGVPVHDDDLARDLHDFFNLIVLVPIVVLNFLNWDWDRMLYGSNTTEVPFVHAWTGEYYSVFFWTTVAYFSIDLVWVCVVPKCVKSPSTIIQHHIAVFAYLILPYLIPKVRFLMGVLMSVELNTWFLIARRVFNKQGFSPWKLDIPYFISVRVKLISIFFYTTWIMIRCAMYPYVLYVMCFPLLRNKGFQDVKNVVLIAIFIQAVFCFLNGKWSLQLLNSKIRQWKKNGETKVASGL